MPLPRLHTFKTQTSTNVNISGVTKIYRFVYIYWVVVNIWVNLNSNMYLLCN